eukprot:jgi/Chrzof1/15022/Cz09g24090.t1
MGRPFVEYIRENDQLVKYVCAKCRADVASSTALIWEGYMGSQQPALLFKQVVNVDPYSSHREERLSTGLYVLVDVECRRCCTPLGWRYVKASSEDQKYKEGGTLLQEDLLKCVAVEH